MMYEWKQKPSTVNGLTYIPTTEPEYSDNDQRMFTRSGTKIGLPLCLESNKGGHMPLVQTGHSVRKSHLDLLRSAISINTMCILEIGVNHYPKPLTSTTTTIIETKQSNCIYLGIDIVDKSFIDNPSQNVHTLQISSNHRDKIRTKLLDLGAPTIDLLMIDGDHSINSTVNDWCFTEFLSESGVVIIHDTNVHIGPRSVFDAIDTTLFEKRRIGTEVVDGKFVDYGMCIIRRL